MCDPFNLRSIECCHRGRSNVLFCEGVTVFEEDVAFHVT